jgi:hypothetical protein
VSFTKDGVWLEDAENREKMAKKAYESRQRDKSAHREEVKGAVVNFITEALEQVKVYTP